MFSMSPRDHVDRFLAFLSPKMACLDAIRYPNFSAVSLSVAHFLKGWPFQYSETLRWKYLDTFFVIGSTRDIGHFHLRSILPAFHCVQVWPQPHLYLEQDCIRIIPIPKLCVCERLYGYLKG